MHRLPRRRFLQVTVASVAGVGLGACGGDDGPAGIPESGLDLGTADEVRAAIADGDGAWYVPGPGVYVVEVAGEHREVLTAAVEASIRPGVEAGFVALHQKCPHQGCRVPHCAESGWFECPCHGSRFSPYGELRRGPSKRGMSFVPVVERGGTLRLHAGRVDGIDDVTGVEPAGPHCV